MKKIFFLLALALSLVLTLPAAAAEEKINLSVPFIPEVHDGIWLPPWNNACEESSITMVSQYYLGITSISVAKARAIMLPLFDMEDKMFGSHADTDAARTAQLANQETAFYATVKENPTIEQIKEQIRQGHPVITMHYGYGLSNPHHRFRQGGSSYHTLVISGFDDATGEFITQDSGDYSGLDYRYKYDTIMNTLKDFNHTNGKADGPARAIFTIRRTLVKAEGSTRIYFLKDKARHYVIHPDLFKKFNWQWRNVRVVSKDFLDGFEDGEAITFNTPAETVNAVETEKEEAPDRIVKAEGSTRIYLIRNEMKHYVCHPNLFKIYGWQWISVETVKKTWLDSLPEGEAIRE